jgi:hypothetical protein
VAATGAVTVSSPAMAVATHDICNVVIRDDRTPPVSAWGAARLSPDRAVADARHIP